MKIQFAGATPLPDERHPLTAALLSFIPGLGQLYVGEKRKGVLYLNVAIINAILLSLCLFAQQIYVSVSAFSNAYHMHVNDDAASALKQMEFGSPASIMLLLLAAGFALYCAREAYDAAYLKRRQIYKDFVLQLTEASSYSYLTHFALMACFAIMALFFISAPKHSIQEMTIIDLNENVPVVKPKQPTQNVARHAAEENGRITNKSDIPKAAASRPNEQHQQVQQKELPSASSPAQKAAAAPVPQPRAVQRQMPPVERPAPTPQAVNPQAARPMPVPTPHPLGATAVPTPAALLPSTGRPLLAMAPLQGPIPATHALEAHSLGLPALPQATSSLRAAGPGVTPSAIKFSGTDPGVNSMAPKIGGQPGAPSHEVPTPIDANEASGPQSGAPHAPVATGPATRAEVGGPGTDGVTPKRASRNPFAGKDGHDLAVEPNLGPSGPGVRSQHTKVGPETPPVTAGPVDFTEYMANLQRRIRKHWFPPHAPQSRVAIVTFTVATDGSLSNVKLTQSTGEQATDNAALQAVQDAAPLPPLPKGAPPTVDIEFTFTYQVFGQDGMHFRRL